jgi:glycerol-3-phosphate dehydrogenase
MAEDCVNQAATLARLAERPCVTGHLNIHGFHPASEKFGHLWVYGSDARMVQELEQSHPAWAEPMDSALPYTGAEVIWAVRHVALTLEGTGATHARVVLNARAALAPRVMLAVGNWGAMPRGNRASWRHFLRWRKAICSANSPHETLAG